MLILEDVIREYLQEKDVEATIDEEVLGYLFEAIKNQEFLGDEVQQRLKIYNEIDRQLSKIDCPEITFSDYQNATRATAIYNKSVQELRISYLVLGLTSEAGEVASELKKAIRDDGSDGVDLKEARVEKIIDEMGDCLWYLAQLADTLNIDLTAIVSKNLKKLEVRYEVISQEHAH